MSASSPTFASWTVTWNETRQRRPPARASASRAATSARTFSTAASRESPGITAAAVAGVAPFQEIFTSDATGTSRAAQAAAPRPGKVPFVVTFSESARSAQRSTRPSSPAHRSGSPIVDGITSRSADPRRSSRTRRASAGSIRRGGRRGPPAARAMPHSHMAQARLQSSGFVTRVSRHGPDARALRAPRPAGAGTCVDNASVVTEK